MTSVLNYTINKLNSYLDDSHITLSQKNFNETDQYVTKRIKVFETDDGSSYYYYDNDDHLNPSTFNCQQELHVYYNQKTYKITKYVRGSSYKSKQVFNYVGVDIVNVEDSYDVIYNCIINLYDFVCVPK